MRTLRVLRGSPGETGRDVGCKEKPDRCQEKHTRNGLRLHLELKGFAGYGRHTEECERCTLALLEWLEALVVSRGTRAKKCASEQPQDVSNGRRMRVTFFPALRF